MTVSSYEDNYLLKGKLQLSNLAVTDDEEGSFDTGVSETAEVDEDFEESRVEIERIKEKEKQSDQISLVKKNANGFPTYIQSGPATCETSTIKKSYHQRKGFMKYKGEYILKTTAIYLLQEHLQISNDRLLRVRNEQPSHLLTGNENDPSGTEVIHIGDLILIRVIDNSGKVLLGRVVQFSYLQGTKSSRRYSSTYVDTSKDSYKTIGVYANYYARYGSENNGLIPFESLDSVFTTGYAAMENFVCLVNSSSVVDSHQDGVAFSIKLDHLVELLPNWEQIICMKRDFIST